MLTYEDGNEPEPMEFPIERNSLIKGDPFSGQKSVIYVGGRKLCEGFIKNVSFSDDEETAKGIIEPGEWSPNPMSISGTVKVSKKDARLFRQQYMKKARLPRKLKKAMRHVAVFNSMPQIDPSCINPESKDVVINMEYYYGVKGDYPRTKWVIMAFKVIRHHLQLFHKMMQERILSESLPNRGPEMVVDKEHQEWLRQMMKS